MTGTEEKNLNIFLMGESTGHISYAINKLGVYDIVFVSSESSYERNTEFLDELEKKGIIIHEKIKVDPFTTDSIVSISSKITEVYEKYRRKGFQITCALTGGTNLMAIAMGLVALVTGSKCHYVMYNNNENRIVNINSFVEIKKQVDLKDLNNVLQGGY